MPAKQVMISDLYQKKQKGEKVSMLTAYDYPGAKLCDAAGVDSVLVGDSLGNVVLGYDSTVPVTMEEMLHHIKAVHRGLTTPLLIGDMPFMSYQISIPEAIRNAGRMMKEGGCSCVKLEGGTEMAPTVRALVNAGIPVCAHIGLTPQSVAQLGGYKVQGKDPASAQKLVDDAKALEDAGASLIVFECIPSVLAAAITKMVSMVTIGIGAGPDCDGQVLVFHDLFGYSPRVPPKMAKQYINLFPQMQEVIETYRREVEEGSFPAPEHGFSIDPAVMRRLKF